MVFAYLIGFALHGILCVIGIKILNFFDPKPSRLPHRKEFETYPVRCVLIINKKSFKATKIEGIIKDYYYSEDCDILEYTAIHKKYTLDNAICKNDMIDKVYMICEVIENNNLIKCYATVDGKNLISYEPETEEIVYSYRKPFKRKKIPA